MYRLHSRSLAFGYSIVGMLIVPLFLTGCQNHPPKEDVERLIKEKLQNHRRSIEILRAVKDRKSMNAALAEFLQNSRQERELAKRMSTLDRGEVESFGQKYAKQFQAAVDEQARELGRIRPMPGGEAFILQIESLTRLE